MTLPPLSCGLARSARLTGGVFLLLVGLAGAAGAQTQIAVPRSWREAIARLRQPLPRAPGAVRGAQPRPLAGSDGAIIAESEPNNTLETADSAALGLQVSGTMDPALDPDLWFVDLTAGQYVSIDVDAQSIGSPLDPRLFLLGPQGEVASNNDFDGVDSRIAYRVRETGRYFVVMPGLNVGGPAFTYVINFGIITCDPVGEDHEPNDAPATASPAAIGTSVTGEICALTPKPAGDVDYWSFTAQAGTTIELDLDAASLGRFVDPLIVLYGADGTTRLTSDNDDPVGPDPRLRYSIGTTSTYYVSVAASALTGEPDQVNPFPYALHLRTIPPGPGDATTVRAAALGLPFGVAAGPNGDMIVTDLSRSRVLRVSTQGVVTTFGPAIAAPLGLAFDAFGGLLVVSADGNVYRITPQGQATPFITDASFPIWIAVAPDGRIWLTDATDLSLRRYSPSGVFETRFDASAVGGLGPGPLAFDASGTLFFSTGNQVWKLGDGALQRVFTADRMILSLAFDVAGNIYASVPSADRLVVLHPDGTTLADPFVVAIDAPEGLAFGRDANGMTVARLFATEPALGQLIEVNPAGLPYPGMPVGASTVTVDVASQALLGAGELSPAAAQFLDAVGNHNGRYDVGDLRAFLALSGELPSAAASRRSGSAP